MNGPTQEQHRHMHALWRLAGVTNREDRLALTGAIVGRALATSSDLTTRDADTIIEYMRVNADSGLLADKAAAWLAAHRTAGAA